MAPSGLIRNQRFWLLAALAVLGVIYSVLITRYYVTNWVALIPIMHRSAFFEVVLRFFWSAVALVPITVAVALLRVRLAYAALTILFYQVTVNAAVFAYAPWNFGEFMGLAIQWPWNFAIQVPVWGLSRLLAKHLTSEKQAPT